MNNLTVYGIATALAASITRSTSVSLTSDSLTATMPWLFIPLMWPPAMPAYTELISQPAINSASSMAFRMELTVSLILITTPFRKPREGAVPMPMMSIFSSFISPTMAQIFVVPMSKPTTNYFFCMLPIKLPCFYRPLFAASLNLLRP